MITQTDPALPWKRAAVGAQGTYDGTALVELGFDIDELEREACTPERVRIGAALAEYRTRPTERYPDGMCVREIIYACGHRCTAKRGGEYLIRAYRCRARPCPRCARAKAMKDGPIMQRFVATRTGAGATLLAVTLTQLKIREDDEDAGQAYQRLRASLRALRQHHASFGDRFRQMFAGGNDSFETTYSAEGGATRYTGFHAHVHGLWEVAPGIDPIDAAREVVDMWLVVSGGADPKAQRIKIATPEHARYFAKYATKGMEEAPNPGAIQSLYEGMRGRRLQQAWGTWRADKRTGRKGWREIGADVYPAAAQIVLRGPSIGAARRAEVLGPSAAPLEFSHPSSTDIVCESAARVMAGVRATIAAQRADASRRKAERAAVLASRHGMHVVHPPRPPDPW